MDVHPSFKHLVVVFVRGTDGRMHFCHSASCLECRGGADFYTVGGSNSGWDLPVWRLHVLHMHVGVFCGPSSFISKS